MYIYLNLACFVIIGLTATLEATGLFIVTMVVSFIVYYLLALPLMIFLMFFEGWGLFGFWIPYVTGTTLECTTYLLVFLIFWRRLIKRKITAIEENSHAQEECGGGSGGEREITSSAVPEDTESEESSATPPVLGRSKAPEAERPALRQALYLLPALIGALMISVIALGLRTNRPFLLHFTPTAHNATHISNNSFVITTVSH